MGQEKPACEGGQRRSQRPSKREEHRRGRGGHATGETAAQSTRWKASVEEKLHLLPNAPGVYLLRDGGGKILYVGKAKRLPARVRSYFRGTRAPDERIAELRRRIRDFDYVVTASETEALVLEASLVRAHAPRFNVELKDDKRYPFLAINTQHPFPRLLLTRKIGADGTRYYGPFTHVKDVRKLLRTLRQVFPLRSCSDRRLDQGGRACLDYFINLCPAPCTGLVTGEIYRATVDTLIAFLEGRGEELLRRWRARMKAHASDLRFEESAHVRDNIERLEQLMESQRMVDMQRPDLDAIGLVVRGARAAAAVFSHRDGAVVRTHRLAIEQARWADAAEIMEAVLTQHYEHRRRIPPLLLCSELPRDAEVVGRWLSDRAGRRVRLVRPQRGKRAELVRGALQNAHFLLEERELLAHGRRERLDASLYALQEALGLAGAPYRIEGYDISMLQGTDAVGARVLFVNGVPRKAGYRRYRIRSVEGSDDFAMLGEMVQRRARRLAEEEGEEKEPDLILVDGGRGQVNRASEVLCAEGFADLPVIGLAKREELIFLPDQPVPVRLPRSSPGLQLLQRVRDEAHRFAVGYHRTLRSKRLKSSALQGVPGLGAKRAALLLRHFGSVAALRRASADEIMRVPGIGPRLAAGIAQVLRDPSGGAAQEG